MLEGHVPTDEECEALLAAESSSKPAARKKLRAGKHNMAKGALRPEDAAVRDSLQSQLRTSLMIFIIILGREITRDVGQERSEEFAESERRRIELILELG